MAPRALALTLLLHVWHAWPVEAAEPTGSACANLLGSEALTCKWKEDAQQCIQQKCQNCTGDCLCQKDTELIDKCCKDHSQVTSSPILCRSAALAESIKSCISTKCIGCSGEQCEVCRKNERTVSKCCEGDFHNVELPKICRRDESGPCQGLSGEESLSCLWGEEVKTCMKSSCSCDSTDSACKVCQQDSAKVAMCCDRHRQSTDPPRICTDAILTQDVMSCIDQMCSSCEGEKACKLCKEDLNLVNQCCIDHQHGFDFPPMCQRNSASILP